MTATTTEITPGTTAAPVTPAASVTIPVENFMAILKSAGVTVEADAKTAASDVAHGSIAGAASEVVTAAKAVGADVKSLPWSHIVTYAAAVASGIALHVFKLFGL